MSYLRGEYYLWRSEEHTHFWARKGNDGWAESIWGIDALGDESPEGDDAPEPAGVGLPQHIVDAFVMMRLAQMVRECSVAAATSEAIALGKGNFGAVDLERLGPAIVAALENLTPAT